VKKSGLQTRFTQAKPFDVENRRMDNLAVVALAIIALGGVAFVLLGPLFTGEAKAEKRLERAAQSKTITQNDRQQDRSRRGSIEDKLKELEQRQKKPRLTLNRRIAQAGLTWSKQQFVLISVVTGLVFVGISFLMGMGLPVVCVFGFIGGFGVPQWLLRFLKKRREQAFIDALPDAVDVIVRGVKSGLPLLDCLKIVATEASEPIRTEFRAILDTQAIGMPLGEACGKLYERTPVPEANFFGISIAIQQRAGGNLSEALGNLSKVLRDRKKMKGKIRAMSQEAKASAGIIGSLPFVVMMLVYFTSPKYITLLFTESLGHVMLVGAAIWMTMGILVMKKMINFDF